MAEHLRATLVDQLVKDRRVRRRRVEEANTFMPLRRGITHDERRMVPVSAKRVSPHQQALR